MSNIAICHFRAGLTDGVSLEIDKWKKACEEMGHKVFLVAGEAPDIESAIIPELYLGCPLIRSIYKNAFYALKDYSSEEEFSREIYTIAEFIGDRINSFIKKYKIDLLIVENIWALPLNIPASIAIYKAVKLHKIKTIAHHHDLFWERHYYNKPTCKLIEHFLSSYFPPDNRLIHHVVINSIARNELAKKRKIQAKVIPNIFDFERSNWKIDDYNADFKEKIGIQPNDIVVLQATRIIPRKGIGLAVDLVKELSKPKNITFIQKKGFYKKRNINQETRIILIFPNLIEDIEYYKSLREKIKKEGIEAMFISDVVDRNRKMQNHSKSYSFWDTYLLADLVTYPSFYEGWGNQFLEAVNAKLPIVIYEYKVFTEDIKEKGFKVISLGSKIRGKDKYGLYYISSFSIKKAAKKAMKLLTDSIYRKQVTELNYTLGVEFYSMLALKKYLEPLI